MANEFKHTDVGDEITKAEYHSTTGHEADGQAAGDLLYCDGTYWKRVAIGANGLYLKAAAVPYWEAILEADIPAAIARDAEVTADIAAHAALAITHGATDAIADQADIAAHAALTTGVHGVGANYLAYTKASQKEALFHNNYMARAYLSANQFDVPNNTGTLVNLNAESYDPGNNFNTANHRYVAPVAGYYVIHGQVTYLTGTVVADKRYDARLYLNGAESGGAILASPTTGYASPNFTDCLHLAANDYVELFCFHQAGVNTVDILGNTNWTFLTVMLLQAD